MDQAQQAIPPALVFWMKRQVHIALAATGAQRVLWLSDAWAWVGDKPGVGWDEVAVSPAAFGRVTVEAGLEKPWALEAESYDLVVVWMGHHCLSDSPLLINNIERLVKGGGHVLCLGLQSRGWVLWSRWRGCRLPWCAGQRLHRLSEWQVAWHRVGLEKRRSGGYLFGRLDARSSVGSARYWLEFWGRLLVPWAGNVLSGLWQKVEVPLVLDSQAVADGSEVG